MTWVRPSPALNLVGTVIRTSVPLLVRRAIANHKEVEAFCVELSGVDDKEQA